MRESKKRAALRFFLTVFLGVAINIAIVAIAHASGAKIYFSALGTALAAVFGGAVPGVLTGFFTSAIGMAFDSLNLYFCLVDVIFAMIVVIFAKHKFFKRLLFTVLSALALSVLCSALSTTVYWLIHGFDFGGGVVAPMAKWLCANYKIGKLLSLFTSYLYIEGLSKFISLIVTFVIYKLVPVNFKKSVMPTTLRYRRQRTDKSSFSIGTKFAALIVATEILLGALTATASYFIYRNIAVNNYADKCRGVSEILASYIDGNAVDRYLEGGRGAEGYKEIEKRFYDIQAAFPRVEYVYAYKIMEDGCHVVFDIDSGDIEGREPGFVEPFDEMFEEYIPALLNGERIPPIITKDSYGWLLTVYTPVYNSVGECKCYAAADVQINRINTDIAIFIAKTLAVFFGVSAIIIVIINELISRKIIYPINSMARTASSFAFSIDDNLEDGVSGITALNISSKDEIGDLYTSLVKMASDTSTHIKEVEHQAEVIERMQESIIMDFAEMVEARDKCTGDHIKKTSYYVGAIAEEMRREGMYPGILSDKYIHHLKRSAPLHDVGKIKVSDTILNKPGRLTEEEFNIMKTHTTEGEQILKGSMAFAQNSDYLKEAANMAAYHHEWWTGKGYPYGLSGEDIPLSARIMAVADVFDALVSRRSYKEPFSFEKAVEIIKEESGTHFDPDVVKAFLNICEQFRTDIK